MASVQVPRCGSPVSCLSAARWCAARDNPANWCAPLAVPAQPDTALWTCEDSRNPYTDRIPHGARCLSR